MIDFETIINKIIMFHKIFDVIRIVDPLHKEVLFMKRKQELDALNIVKSTCYSFWASGHVCENCISMRALSEKDVFVKFEYVHSRLYLTTAYPLETPYSQYVVEVIKDVTQSELLEGPRNNPKEDIFSNIMHINRHIITDALTGLFNKRYLLEKLPYELVNNHIKGYDCAVLMLELDQFKDIAPLYGQGASDFVLKGLASVLSECVREDYDWIARLGEGGFVIYLKNIKMNDLNLVYEKIKSQVETYDFTYNATNIPVTISIGASHVCSDKTCDVDTLLSFSKELLHQAQNQGQNKFVSKEVTL